MASSSLLHSLSLHRRPAATYCCSSASHRLSLHRRSLSLSLLALPVISTVLSVSPSRAQDIPLFGLRKKLKQVEEEAVEIVKEGEQAVEKEIQTAEQGIEAAEEQVVAGGLLGFGVAGDLMQAGAVAGAEAVGVVVAVSVVNGILGPEGKN